MAIFRGKQLSGGILFYMLRADYHSREQLSERALRHIAIFHIVRFPGVRGQTTISVEKNQLCSSFSYNSELKFSEEKKIY